MPHLIPTLSKFRNYPLILSLAIGCSLLVAPAALAIKYQKPPQPTAPRGSTTGGGVRGGCDGKSAVGLTALAPIDHVGKTTSLRPTIAWFTSNPAVPVKVMLYRSGDAQETSIATQELRVNPNYPGIVQLQLPQELALNQEYSWRVLAECPSGSKLVAKAHIQVVQPTADLQKALGKVNGLKKAELYATQGFWYDALAEVLSLSPKPASQENTRSLLSELVAMEQSTLQDLEKQPVNCTVDRLNETCQQRRSLGQHIANLNAILNLK
jgi:hypothetical protein